MKYAAALLAFAAAAVAQSCQDSADYQFSFNTQNLTKSAKRDALEPRQQADCSSDGTLKLSLTKGVLTDSKGRIGSIVANHQFQFDGPPPQAGAIHASGWCLNSNGSLALNGGSVFYNCLSGDFNNIYDESQGGQCYPVYIVTLQCAGAGPPVTPGASATQIPTGSASASSPSSENLATEMNTAVPTPQPSTPPAAANSSAPAGTASSGPATTTQPTTKPSPFTGAGVVVEVGQKIVALAAGVAAFALV